MTLAITTTKGIVNYNPDQIPKFTHKEFAFLEDKFPSLFPQGTCQLKDRVLDFKRLAEKLDGNQLEWGNTAMLITVSSATLVTVTALGLISLGLPVAIGTLTVSFLLVCFGALYLKRLDEKHSRREERFLSLALQLKNSLKEASQFWQKHGNAILLEVEKSELTDPDKRRITGQIQIGQRLETK